VPSFGQRRRREWQEGLWESERATTTILTNKNEWPGSDYFITATYRGWICNAWRHRAYWRADRAPRTCNCRCLLAINLDAHAHGQTDGHAARQTGARRWSMTSTAAIFQRRNDVMLTLFFTSYSSDPFPTYTSVITTSPIYKCSAVAEMGDRLATTDMGRKLAGVPFLREEGELGPHQTQCCLDRAYLRTKWHLDPSSRMATTDTGRK